jgi:hypothetical protein
MDPYSIYKGEKMRELDFIEAKIEPSYGVSYGGGAIKRLHITVKYNGKEYHATENLWHSDAISVLDHCFNRAKQTIKEYIEAANKEGE